MHELTLEHLIIGTIIAIGVLGIIWFVNRDDFQRLELAKPCLESVAKKFCEDRKVEYGATLIANTFSAQTRFYCLDEWREIKIVQFTQEELKRCGAME